jgi:hypothetical protein
MQQQQRRRTANHRLEICFEVKKVWSAKSHSHLYKQLINHLPIPVAIFFTFATTSIPVFSAASTTTTTNTHTSHPT